MQAPTLQCQAYKVLMSGVLTMCATMRGVKAQSRANVYMKKLEMDD